MSIITFHIQPRASRAEVVGYHGDAIKIRIQSPPVDGTANQELIRFLANAIGIPRSDITIVSGETGRRKRIAVANVPPDEVERRLGVRRTGV